MNVTVKRLRILILEFQILNILVTRPAILTEVVWYLYMRLQNVLV
jgi:hypothetical protein